MKTFISKLKGAGKKISAKTMAMALAFVLTLGMTVAQAAPATFALADTSPATTPGASGGDLSEIEDKLGIGRTEPNEHMLGNSVDLIGMLARVIGVLLGVYGLYKLIVAFKDQDANGITQGIVLLAVGIILLMFKTIVSAVFGI